ncbi:hypothetical protein DSECCO2_226930 [anaerobic digester metagenome]
MQINFEGGQGSLFAPDFYAGKTSRAHTPAHRGVTSKRSSRKSSRLKNHTFMLLDLRPGAGNMLGPYWEYDPPWLGSLGTLNTSECPRDVVESSLSQILQATVPSRYYLSKTACFGILRRANERGKPLPPQLETALRVQAGISKGTAADWQPPMAFAANQRDEVRDLHNIAAALGAQQGMKQQTFVAAFSAGAGPSAGTIGYHKELAPTLKGSASGNMAPSVLCINDQGGQVMDCTENLSGTLRAQEHGHQPLVFENHGQDSRFNGPAQVSQTVSASFGAGFPEPHEHDTNSYD